jgi:hypothetical protein
MLQRAQTAFSNLMRYGNAQAEPIAGRMDESEIKMNIEKAIRDAVRRKAEADSRQLPKGRIVREESNGESLREYHPQGHGLYFCLHGKSYFDKCSACRRTASEASDNFDKFLSK